ncbi:hypothetical protein PLESTM_000342300 [Pleodorina starrii]|nr:hypothetical protein PLESTM_000342300 [Pleodorina starrii]
MSAPATLAASTDDAVTVQTSDASAVANVEIKAKEAFVAITSISQPVGAVVKGALSTADVATDLLVLATWWRIRGDYTTWAIISSAIMLTSCSWASYRCYRLGVERPTFALMGLDQDRFQWLRAVLGFIGLHHTVTAATEIRGWAKLMRLQGRGWLGTGKVAGEPAPEDLAAKERIKVAALKESADIEATASWWRCYEVALESMPQLCLQSYVLMLTRKFTVLNIASIALGICTISWAITNTFSNKRIGLPYLSVLPCSNWRSTLALFTFFLGSIGLRVSTAVLLIVAVSWWGGLYFSGILLSCVLTTLFLVYGGSEAECWAMACTVLVDEEWESYIVTPVLYAKGTFPFYYALNFVAAGPGLGAYGWKWTHRMLAVQLNIWIRLLESWLGAMLVFTLTPLKPCIEDSDVRYTDNGCNGCCRGPIVRNEALAIFCSFSVMYILGFWLFWRHQAPHLRNAPAWSTARLATRPWEAEDPQGRGPGASAPNTDVSMLTACKGMP